MQYVRPTVLESFYCYRVHLCPRGAGRAIPWHRDYIERARGGYDVRGAVAGSSQYMSLPGRPLSPLADTSLCLARGQC